MTSLINSASPQSTFANLLRIVRIGTIWGKHRTNNDSFIKHKTNVYLDAQNVKWRTIENESYLLSWNYQQTFLFSFLVRCRVSRQLSWNLETMLTAFPRKWGQLFIAGGFCDIDQDPYAHEIRYIYIYNFFLLGQLLWYLWRGRVFPEWGILRARKNSTLGTKCRHLAFIFLVHIQMVCFFFFRSSIKEWKMLHLFIDEKRCLYDKNILQ